MPFKKGEPNPGKKFVKGKSGNPRGMSKEVASYRDKAVRMAARKSPKAISALGRIMVDPSKEDGPAVSAAKEILDRGLGKSAQIIEASIHVELQSMTDDELRAAIREELKRK